MKPVERPASKALPAWLGASLLLGLTLIVYWPLRHAGFIWDDDSFLTENPLIKQVDGLRRFWFSADAPDYFPMTSTSLWLEWRLWGMNAAGYHFVNILLHGASAALLWRMLVKLNIPGAWLAAALFAAHPVNVESVAWITQRKNTLAMFFYAGSLWCYLRLEETGRRRFYWLALGAFALALLSKTAVAPMPFVLLAIAWWRRGRIGRADVWRSLGFFALALIVGLISVWFQNHRAIGTAMVREDGFFGRLAGAGWALWFYLYKALLPVNLLFVYPRWAIAAANPLSYLPLALWAAALFICWHYRHGWGRGPLFALGYFTVMLLPVLGFLNIFFMRYSLVADHWQYFAIIGPLAFAAAGIMTGFDRLPGGYKWVKWISCGALLAALSALTSRQLSQYTDAETMWRSVIAANPDCWMARENLAETELRRGQADQAMDLLKQALEVHPNDSVAYNDLGFAYFLKGRLNEGIDCLENAVKASPNDAKAHYNLGRALINRGDLTEAILHLQNALKLEPGLWEAHDKLGEALMQKGRSGEAIAHFQKSLDLKPDNPAAYKNLANTLVEQGRPREAISNYEKAIELRPDFGGALNDFAWLLSTCKDASLRNGTAAVDLALRAQMLAGGQDPGVGDTVAAAYAEAGKPSEAISSAEKALELARSKGQEKLAGKIEAHLKLFRAGLPVRDGGK